MAGIEDMIMKMFGLQGEPTPEEMVQGNVPGLRPRAQPVRVSPAVAGNNFPGNYPNVNAGFSKASQEGNYEYPPQIDGMQSASRLDPVPTGMFIEDDEGIDPMEMEDPVSDSGNAERINRIIDEYDASEFAQMPGKEALTEVLGLNVSPQLEAFWDKTDPADRLAIIDAINTSAGMASDADIIKEVGGKRPSVEDEVIKKVMDEE